MGWVLQFATGCVSSYLTLVALSKRPFATLDMFDAHRKFYS